MAEKKRTDVLFIMPPYRLGPPYEYKLIDPPHSLIVLATVLKSAGYEVKIFDMAILEIGYETIAPYIEKVKPRIVGIQNRSTYSYPIVQKTAQVVKEADSSLPVIVGGTHVSYNPKQSLGESEFIDYILVGETEITLPRFLEAVLLGKRDVSEVEGLVYRDSEGAVRRTDDFIPLDDLAKLPPPDLDLVPIDRYVERNERYIIHLSRGCQYSCPYCTSEFVKNNLRFRPTDHVVEEIKLAYERGFRNFYFFDNMFTVRKDIVKETCKKIVEADIHISWPCMTNVGTVDDDLLSWMRKAGCDLIAYGIETMTEKALHDIGKHRQAKKIQETFTMTRKHGIRPLAFVIFGLPNTELTDEFRTIKFITEIGPDAVRSFCFKPFPGTHYYEHAEEFGILDISQDLTRWSILDEPTHHTTLMSEEEIIEARLVSEYLFRSGGTVSHGVKYRRRKNAVLIKTSEGGLMYNPYLPQEQRKTDMYLSCLKMDKIYYEVLFRCDGYHNLADINEIVVKLFDMSAAEAKKKIRAILDEAMERLLIEEIPDVMAGRTTSITNEEVGAMAAAAFVT